MNTVDDKRSAILNATLQLISEHGFHGTAMSKIAKEAGVSAGIIYHYFESKDALIDALYINIKQEFGRVLMAQFDTCQPTNMQVRQIVGLMMRYYIQHPKKSAFLEQYVRSPYYSVEMEAQVMQYYKPLYECFERANMEMLVKDFPPAVMAAFTLDVATSLAQKQAMGFIELTDALIERIIDASWEALRR